MRKFLLMAFALTGAMMIGATTYTKVTSALQDWSGQYLIAYDQSATEALVFNGKDEASDYVTATASGGVITSDDLSGYLVTIAAMEGGYSVQVSDGKYIGGSSSKNTIAFGANPKLNTISMSGTKISIMSETKTLQFNSNKDDMRFRYYASSQKQISLYKADTYIPPIVVTYDTISVSEARQRISESKLDACYIKCVVATAPTDPASYGNTTCWLTDIDSSTDSIYGYQIAGLNGASVSKIEDIPFHLGDTVMLYANKLENFNGKYEINGGYFVEMLGKTQIEDVSELYKYGVGAVAGGTTETGKFIYDVVLSKENAEDFDKALHMTIHSSKEKGIAGSYTLYKDNSYVTEDGVETPLTGSIRINYISDAGNYTQYSVSVTYLADGNSYSLSGEYILPGWNSEGEAFKLVDDMPFIPNDGDTITCAEAASFATTLNPDEESPLIVWVRGFATGFQKLNGRTQQSIYMNDDPKAKSGIFTAYLCYTQNLDSIVKGDEVLVKGSIVNSVKGNGAQISKGQIYRIGGSNTKRVRNIVPQEAPDGAISVARAMEIGNALSAAKGESVSTSEEYTVVGYIAKVSYQTKNDTASWYMADEADAGFGDLQAYKCYIPDLICKGDKVFLTGHISKYVKDSSVTIEISKGAGQFIEESTSIERIMAAPAKFEGRKMIVNGRLMILKNRTLYNALGAIIR